MRHESIWVYRVPGTGWAVNWPVGNEPFARWFLTWADAMAFADELVRRSVVREVEGRGAKTTTVGFPAWAGERAGTAA